MILSPLCRVMLWMLYPWDSNCVARVFTRRLSDSSVPAGPASMRIPLLG